MAGKEMGKEMSDNHIIDTSELAETEWDGHSEPDDVRSDISATKQSVPEARLEFHVQMKRYTLGDMDDLIINAAAKQIVNSFNSANLAKEIEERCMKMVRDAIDQKLAGITAEIIDQPVTPSYGDKKPVTMRELIALYGREYLDQLVNSDGEPNKDTWGRDRKPRSQWLVERHCDAKFKHEIAKAVSTASAEIQIGIKARMDAFITAEKNRLRDALAKATI